MGVPDILASKWLSLGGKWAMGASRDPGGAVSGQHYEDSGIGLVINCVKLKTVIKSEKLTF